MRFYNQPHQYYCCVDLHARSMYLCIRDQAGTIVFHHNLAAEANTFLSAIEPYKAGLVVGCECMFAWYWLADLCAQHQIDFVLLTAAPPTPLLPLTRQHTIRHRG